MQIISSLKNFERPWDKCILTLGDFDGIHKGHQKLLSKAISVGKKQDLPVVLLTYYPSPKKVMQKLKYDMSIYTRNEKISILQQYPLRAIVFFPFDKKVAKMSAKTFLQEIMIKKLNAKNIVIGYDHHFGLNRKGNFRYLTLCASRYDLTINQVSSFSIFNEVVSSSNIRKYLQEGNIKKTNKMLGEQYLIMGTVIRGKQLGRTIGIPTANILIDNEKLIPKSGVYVAIANIASKKYLAVVNIGNNPTFGNTDTSIEAHLLKFNYEVYGETLKLELLDRLRDERKFKSIRYLTTQINKDIEKAKKLYSKKL